ncbi:hypothetical protein J3Q64DRAFT_1753997 [Phycomyces blakesleeanus]|uniref:Uncharacterized protein n=1 Tax=Phycomyces blakesleeanus TaxID=4837 RepID=A0ABR3ATC0_PHYBL
MYLIYLFNINFRASHLVDLHLPLDRSRDLLDMLKRNPDSKDLVLLQFGDRFTFFANVVRLRQHYETTLAKDTSAYIDIQGKQPVLRDCPSQLTDWLTHNLKPFLDNRPPRDILFLPTVPTCMVTLTGWALEYPVIYTSHQDSDTLDSELDEWEVRTNCLGGRCLNVVRILIDGHVLVHNNVDDHKNEHALRPAAQNTPKQETQMMLLSFSYPATLLTKEHQLKIQSDLDTKINHRLQDSTTAWLKAAQVKVIREQVNLDRVAL